MSLPTAPVAVADVYKGDALAAQLRRTEAGVEFAYLPSYLSAGGPAVATTLPLSGTAQLQPGGGVPPFFAGLLPEGRRLSLLRRAVKTSADDDLTLLAAVGADTIGDVRVLPAGAPDEEPSSAITVARDLRAVSFTEVLEQAGMVDPVGLPGVQDKLSLRMISLPVASAGRRYILKLDPPEYPHVVANEAYFLGLARRARVPAARASVVHDRDGRPGLLVERFDRGTDAAGGLVRLAVEDGTQVLGRYPADKYAVPAEQVLSALASLCAARTAAVHALFGQVLFAWLTGNGDQHAKNLAVLRTDAGEWRVTPMYDAPSTLPYGDVRAALTIDGASDGFSNRRFLAFAEALGLPHRAAQSAITGALTATARVIPDIEAGALPFGPAVIKDMVRVLRFRRRALDPR